jgi:hypothetical protein
MTEIEFRPRAFLIGWLVGGVLVYPITIVLLAALWGGLAVVFGSFYRSDMGSGAVGFLTAGAAFLISGAVIGFCVGMVQRWLLRRYLSWTADHWRRYSALGGAIGACVAALVYGLAHELMRQRTGYSYNRGQADTAAMVIMPLFIGVVSVMQWMTLRHAVRHALLWVMANVVGGLIFSGMLWVNGPKMDPDLAWVAPFIAVLGQSFVTGSVMLWLFEKLAYPIQDGEDEPIKVHAHGPRSVWDEAI